MRYFIIKIGKIINILKREGIIGGLKNLLYFAGKFFKIIFTPVKGDVLIITSGVGSSAMYRSSNHAEELNSHNIKTAVMLQDNPFLPNYADRCKIFIFNRSMVTPTVAKLIKRAKKQNKEIIFDTDDLVFDPKFIQATDLYKYKMNIAEKMQYQKGVGEEILKDPYNKVCTTTTTYLGKILESYGKKVFIVPNKISDEEMGWAQNILEIIPKKSDGAIRLGYFSGTASHNKDFATIIDALAAVMEKYKNVILHIVGPLDLDSNLNKFKERIISLPFVPRRKYYENIYEVDINLAPLVLNDPFCECKSEIKFSEPGILEIPTVAVRNQTFSEAIKDGVDGFLADNAEEWAEKIGRLIEDRQLRLQMGKKAREKVLADFTNKNSHNEEYYDYLRSLIKKQQESGQNKTAQED